MFPKLFLSFWYMQFTYIRATHSAYLTGVDLST